MVVGHMALAQFITSQQIGNFTFTSGTDANGSPISGSSIRIGDSVFHNFNLGNGQTANGSTLSIGDTDFHNVSLSDGSMLNGTSQYLGNFGFHNFFGSNGGTANGTSMAIGSTTFTSMNILGCPSSFYPDSTQVEGGQSHQQCSWQPAKFTFSESQVQGSSKHQAQTHVQIFDTPPARITAAGILVSPSEVKSRSFSPGPTLDELYERASDAIKHKRFVMIANVAGIYNNTHRVLLDTCDAIKFSASEFKKIRDKWKVGDLVSISEWEDDRGHFVDYELEVYGKPSARGEVVDE